MDDNTEIKLSLLENSHAFIREAVTYAVSAKDNARKWQFAVLNLVQALELSLKALLFNIHPILIFLARLKLLIVSETPLLEIFRFLKTSDARFKRQSTYEIK
jgi:HEPN domain-containing protein